MSDERLTTEEMASGIINVCHAHLESKVKIVAQIRTYGEQCAAEARKATLEDMRREVTKDEFQMIVGPYGNPASDGIWIDGHDHAIGRVQVLLDRHIAASPAPEVNP